MTLSSDQAAESLKEIDRTGRRSAQAYGYANASPFFVIWGVIWMFGYTGSDQSRQEMLQNTHFVDAKVDLFAKYGSTQWTRLGTYPIARQLLAK